MIIFGVRFVRTLFCVPMLSKEEILELLRQVKPELEAYGVSKIGLFGSYVRGEATEKSDIDILIDFQDIEHSTLRNLSDTDRRLKKLFRPRRIDVVPLDGLSRYIGPVILKEVRYV